MSSGDHFSCLKGCKMFVDNVDEHASKIDFKLTNTNFNKDELILSKNNTSSDIFIIRSGIVKLFKIVGDKEVILELLKEGDIFGTFLGVNISENIFAEAVEKSSICKLNFQIFENLIQKYPTIATSIINELSNRLNDVQKRILNVTTGKAEDMVLSELIRLAKSFGKQYEGYYVLRMKLSHQQIADFIGITRESVSHSISKLTKKGLLLKTNSLIKIKI